MSDVNKKQVYELYDEITNWFDSNRNKGLMEREYLEILINKIPEKGKILDLGCGSGEPIAKFLIEKHFTLYGVDGSKNMIELCKQRFPNHKWFVADMSILDLKEKFDAIIAWDSFFHLTQDQQRHMFNIFRNHINNDGILLFTSGTDNGEVVSKMNGRDIYHSSLSTNEYRALLKEYDFEEILYRSSDPNCGDHTVWLTKSIK